MGTGAPYGPSAAPQQTAAAPICRHESRQGHSQARRVASPFAAIVARQSPKIWC